MNRITGTIITLNNEAVLEDCILSLKNICDEIIVLDSLSNDRTVQIAKDLGARVYSQDFLGDGPQKKLAASYSTNDWIFSLDADERIEPDLIEYVNNLSLQSSDSMSYSFKRRYYCGKKWIKAASFYADRVIRLYNKKFTGYTSSTSHAYVDSSAIATDLSLIHI